jgi:hypothetical protein
MWEIQGFKLNINITVIMVNTGNRSELEWTVWESATTEQFSEFPFSLDEDTIIF